MTDQTATGPIVGAVPCRSDVHAVTVIHDTHRSTVTLRVFGSSDHQPEQWAAYGFGDSSAVACAATSDTVDRIWSQIRPVLWPSSRFLEHFTVFAHWYTHHRDRCRRPPDPVEFLTVVLDAHQAGRGAADLWENGPVSAVDWITEPCWRTATATNRVLLPETTWNRLTAPFGTVDVTV